MNTEKMFYYLNLILNTFIKRKTDKLLNYRHEYSLKSDDELKLIVENTILNNEKVKKDKKNFIIRFFLFIKNLFHPDVNEESIKNLALGIEIFNRAPADLPERSYLYNEQIEASLLLLHNTLVQMNTGEGKTYVILPSALSLVCKYGKVYIVCANKQLAIRDANRTKNFWIFAGISVGLFLDENDDDELEYKVVYTTLDSLLFYKLKVEISLTEKDKLKPFSIILDEADSILLDQSNTNFDLVTTINQKSYDWAYAIKLSNELSEPDHIKTNMKNMKSTLSESGEEYIKANKRDNEYILLRRAVEISYFALNKIEEGIDYVNINDNFYPVNQLTGLVEYNKTPIWLTPIKYLNNINLDNESIVLNTINPSIFLQNFEHLSGLSGTLTSNIFEYLTSYHLTVNVIKSRYEKKENIDNDYIFLDKQNVYSHIIREVTYYLELQQPILIGTQNIGEAEYIYSYLKKYFNNNILIQLVSGKNEFESISIFEKAGEVNTITITTQFAGRGIDIRLSEQSKLNGGMVLLAIEHSLEKRHDFQFMGRVGRHGDPYSVKFICSLEDELLLRFNANAISDIMIKLGIEDGERIESSMVTKAIFNAQKQISRVNFFQRNSNKILNLSLNSIKEKMLIWFDYAKVNEEELFPSDFFIKWLIEHFIKNHLIVLNNSKKRFNSEDGLKVKNILINKLNLNEEDILFLIGILEGLNQEQVIKEIKKFLFEIIKKSFDKYNEIFDFFCNIKEEDLRVLVKKIEPNPISELPCLMIDEDYNYRYDQNTNDKIKIEEIDKPFKEANLFGLTFIEMSKVINRNPIKVLNMVIRYNWRTFLYNRERTIYKINILNYSIFETNRLIDKMVNDDFEIIEKNISLDIIKYFINSSSSFSFNDLFSIEDSEVLVNNYNIFEKENDSYKEFKNDRNLVNEKSPEVLENNLVDAFIKYYSGKKDIDEETMSVILNAFLKHSPLFQLQEAESILKAIEKWNDFQIKNNTDYDIRKRNLKWIEEFLIYLKKENMVNSLPVFYDKVKLNITTFFNSLKDIKIIIPFSLMIISALIFIIMTLISVGFWGLVIDGNLYFSIIDSLLFSNLLEISAFTTPILVVIVIVYIISSFIVTPTNVFIGIASIERHLLLIGVISIFLFFINIHETYKNIYDLAFYFIIFLSIYILSSIFYSVISYVNREVNINLIDIILLINIFFIFSNHSIFNSMNISFMLVLSFFALIYFLFLEYNYKNIKLVTVRIKDNKSLNTENIINEKKIISNIGISPYIFSSLFAFSLFELCIMLKNLNIINVDEFYINSFVSMGYLILLCFLIFYSFKRQLSLTLWKKYLHDNYVEVYGIDSDSELSKNLNLIAINMIKRRIILFLVTAILIYIYSYNLNLLFLDTYPIYLFLLTIVIVFSIKFYHIVKKLYSIFMENSFYKEQILNIDDGESQDINFITKVKLVLNSTPYKVISFFILLVVTTRLLIELHKLYF